MALCILPVATPLLAAGVKSLFAGPGASGPAFGPTHEPLAGRPQLRASLDAPAFLPDPMMSPEPLGARARLEAAPVSVVPQQASRPAPRVAERPAGPQVLRNVSVVDGLQISSDGMIISLAGIGPAPQGSECRRLDGVVEPCAQRAANRLDILTRGRPVVCDIQQGDGAMRGVCRAGKIDLAEDLVRNGLAVRTSDRL